MISIISFALFWYKPGILRVLTKGLKEISIVKNKQKKLYNAATYKTWEFEIWENIEIKKKWLNFEKKLGNCGLALKKRQ